MQTAVHADNEKVKEVSLQELTISNQLFPEYWLPFLLCSCWYQTEAKLSESTCKVYL